MMSRNLSDQDITKLGVGAYALFRTLNAIRFAGLQDGHVDVVKIHRIYAKRGMDSRTRKLLQFIQ